MANFSNYLEETLLNATLRGVDFTAPSVLYASLHTAAGASESTAAWAATELTGSASNYSRLSVATSSWTDPSGTGLCATNTALTFPTAGNTWGTITHFALWDSANSGATPVLGNMYYWFALPTARTVNNGDTFNLTAGNVSVQLL